ncbi:hypothetical protein GLOTRDRAFT_140607 [Gloeophyllum trabeum ATCC 11539]|uniref:BUB1 N-terminal domain-containing protein n=1 Tax=Gloeophyllum trabeum (strain ATCC 11539 / FP-39264 / Madison 617) TaxID=670483 RepID=S7PXF9_GLOTA|nr:uncharacterized protein GLOTRDRAFT_140607 [Gloeophyllum trabeum ATCC 11539]EPQ52203.1 hypothetical protein GLOTRDRAFT_140607 [Gloeophyllum trabeum ATCC 11539]
MATAAADVDIDDHESNDDEVPEIVDFDVIEKAKENIRPIASGRRVTALSQILSTPHAQREAHLSAMKNRYRINVQVALEDEDDDPLEVYYCFVRWTVENYPQGHNTESGLLELLEEATRVLKDDRGGKWRQDIRYLKLWILYASYVERPAIIYRFCIANDIGTEHELLYEEFALSLERSGRRAEADKVYLLGIARRAEPLDRLRKKHEDFQKRMMVAAPIPQPDELASEVSAASSTKKPPRQALATRAVTTEKPHEDVFSSNAATSRPRPNARLQIFEDPADAEPELMATNAFPNVGTRTSRVKENVPEVKKASGTTLRQAGRSQRLAAAASGRSGASRIAVFVDPEPEPVQESTPDEMQPPPVPERQKGKAMTSQSGMKACSFTPFVDDAAEARKKKDEVTSSRVPAKYSNFTPFVDDEAEGSGTAKKKKKGEAACSRALGKSSSFTSFCEDDAAEPETTSKNKGKVAASQSAAKTRSFSPFCDSEADAQETMKKETKPMVMPCTKTATFTPFCDADSEAPEVYHDETTVTEGPVIKVKKAGARDTAPATEAEALRRDPFKNYDKSIHPDLDGDDLNLAA